MKKEIYDLWMDGVELSVRRAHQENIIDPEDLAKIQQVQMLAQVVRLTDEQKIKEGLDNIDWDVIPHSRALRMLISSGNQTAIAHAPLDWVNVKSDEKVQNVPKSDIPAMMIGFEKNHVSRNLLFPRACSGWFSPYSGPQIEQSKRLDEEYWLMKNTEEAKTVLDAFWENMLASKKISPQAIIDQDIIFGIKQASLSQVSLASLSVYMNNLWIGSSSETANNDLRALMGSMDSLPMYNMNYSMREGATEGVLFPSRRDLYEHWKTVAQDISAERVDLMQRDQYSVPLGEVMCTSLLKNLAELIRPTKNGYNMSLPLYYKECVILFTNNLNSLTQEEQRSILENTIKKFTGSFKVKNSLPLHFNTLRFFIDLMASRANASNDLKKCLIETLIDFSENHTTSNYDNSAHFLPKHFIQLLPNSLPFFGLMTVSQTKKVAEVFINDLCQAPFKDDIVERKSSFLKSLRDTVGVLCEEKNDFSSFADVILSDLDEIRSKIKEPQKGVMDKMKIKWTTDLSQMNKDTLVRATRKM